MEKLRALDELRRGVVAHDDLQRASGLVPFGVQLERRRPATLLDPVLHGIIVVIPSVAVVVLDAYVIELDDDRVAPFPLALIGSAPAVAGLDLELGAARAVELVCAGAPGVQR